MMGGQHGSSVALTGIGMVTSVGFGAYPACAAIRAGISRFRELHETQGLAGRPRWKSPLVGSPLDGLTEGYFGLGRWTRMAVDALRDLMVNARLGEQELAQTGIFLGLPRTGWPSGSPERRSQLARRIAQWLQVPGLHKRIRFYSEGHASALQALHDVLAHLQQGQLDQAVIGGIDSLLEQERLAQLFTAGRLKTEENPVGLIPGEAAAFFLVESSLHARRRKAKVLAWVSAPSLAQEPITPTSGQPCNGLALGRAISATLASLEDRGAQLGLIVCDLNGELFRAEEFSKMTPRALASLQHPWLLWHPADCIGDTGTASSAISVCVGARALSQGYAETNHALICGASDEGLRGSVYLHSANPEDARL